MEERRQFVRAKDLKLVKVRVENSSGAMDCVEIKDMSLGGVNFYSETKFEKDQIIQLEIALPNRSQYLNLEGRVLWQLCSLGGKFATGVRFQHIEEQCREQLSKFIHKHAKRVNEGREFIRCALNSDIVINDLNNPSIKIPAKAIDISHGGMKLTLMDKVAIGASLKASLILPQDDESIEFAAKVVWVRKEMDKDGFAAGIIYTEMDAAVKNKIFRFIDNYCNAS